MRMGKPRKKSRAWHKAGERGKPKYISPESVVGQVSPDLISSVFAPKIKEIAVENLERYAQELLDYEDLIKEMNESEAQVNEDGSVRMNVPQPPHRPLFHSQFMIDDFSATMSEASDHFFSKRGGWKVHANAAKFERMLDEKYGIFRPFITNHPGVEQFIRSVQRKHAMGYFSPFRQGDPPIPITTAVIILFMMQRGGVRWEIMILGSLFFLIGLQPWALVAIVALVQGLCMRRKQRAIGTMKTSIAAVEPYYSDAVDDKQKQDILLQPVGTPLKAKEQIETSAFDTILLGSGPACLYTASLLSRAGRKVLVLSSREDASGCLTLSCLKDSPSEAAYKDIPFDIEASNISKISRQQQVLAPALCTTTDCQGGIRFAQIGSEADGYAFEILSIPGMGVDGTDQEIPFILKAAGGLAGLMDDAATLLGDGWPGPDGHVGHSTTGAYVNACESVNYTASLYYLSKILPDSVNNLRSSSAYQESAIRYASAFLNKSFPLNAHARSLMAGIGMKGENLKPSATSLAAHITNVSAATCGEGMHYPIGGPRALCHALSNIVERSGGRVLTNVKVSRLLFEEVKGEKPQTASSKEGDDGPPPPRCIGVQLSDAREIKFSPERYAEDAAPLPAIVSMEGMIRTFIDLVSDEIRDKYKVPRGLPALSERRPVFKILFVLKGSAEDLSVTGADYYRLPGAAIARDEIDPVTGNVTFGEIGWSEEDVGESESKKEDDTEDVVKNINKEDALSDIGLGTKRRRGPTVKFETGSSWLHISFPSAKDPSFESRYGKVTTCVVTIEADDDFCKFWDTKPKLCRPYQTSATSGNQTRLLDRVRKDLFEIFPQLQENVEHYEIRGPLQRGLSHNPERYAAKGVRADTPYPGLYIGGSDLTVGESFSASIVGGWLAANAVVGYSPLDHLFLKKNVTSDLEQFMEPPALTDVDDVAVPFSPRTANFPVAEVDPIISVEDD